MNSRQLPAAVGSPLPFAYCPLPLDLLYNPRVVNVEILTIGNEILLGLIQDTNSNYLCRVVRGMGGRVRHIAIVRDEIDEIAKGISDSIARGADVIFTCGGLGPTDDDLTLAAIAKATNRNLAVDENAREFVERRYRELETKGFVADSIMTEARLKMARLPQGAQAVDNPIGAAPASQLLLDGARIISLPGVPAEMKAIVEGPLQSVLAGLFGHGSYREKELYVDCGDESGLAPVLRRVATSHPEVYIKSRASHFGRHVTFRIVLSSSASSAEEADRMIAGAATELTLALANAGISEPS